MAVSNRDIVDQVLFGTKDPTVQLGDLGEAPAMTVLLHRVCDNNVDKFEEATRLVELFIARALEIAPQGTATAPGTATPPAVADGL